MDDGPWASDPRGDVVVQRFTPEMLHGFSFGVSELCVANAHLDMFLSQTDAETVLEVLDNEGTASAIVGLVGRTPRMAECAIIMAARNHGAARPPRGDDLPAP
jgi:hypothetical protein